MQDKKPIKINFIVSITALLKRAFLGGGVSFTNFEEDALKAPMQVIFEKMLKSKLAVFGALAFITVFILCFLGSALIPLNENYTELTHANLPPSINYLNYPSELSNKKVVKISSGISFSVAITDMGEFYIWGTEANKEQKNVSDYIFDVPLEVTQNKIVDVAAGGNHVTAIDENGNFYTWGYKGSGQLDIPSTVTDTFKNLEIDIKQISALSQWTAVLGTNGELYLWGSTGAKNTLLISSKIQGRITKFAGADNNIALLLDDGTITVIGDQGTEFATQLPEQLTSGSVNVVDIAATNRNVLALDDKGNVYSWGGSQDELLKTPQFDEKISGIHAGYRNFIALSENGNITIWGDDNYAQLNLPDNAKDITTIFADYFQFYGIDQNNEIIAWGNKGYFFGSDQFGRDIFTRIIHGGRISLTVGALAVVISTFIALFVGLCSGYFGGWVDHVLMRITDVFSAIPFFPIAITLSYAIGFSLSQAQKMYLIMIILGLLGWMSLARFIRAQLLLEREKDFVLAARALGLRNGTIMWQHILPNIFNVVIVNLTLSYASSLLSEASLSFLGFGVAEPTPSWGNMLNSAQDISVIQFYWWRWLIPALFVIITTLSVNLVGDALREVMDPKAEE